MLRTLFVLLAISLPVSAQCTQKIATLPAAPELFGFRLGMTKDEIKALVPQAQFSRNDPFGVAKTTINPHFDQTIDQAKYKGVRSISLDLLDSQLISLWIGFDDTYKIHDVDEFVKSITGALQLSGSWSSWRSRGQQLRCGDFQLIVTTLAGGPSLRLLNFGAEDTIAARRQAKEEQDALAAEVAAGGENGEEATTEVIGDKQSKTYYSNRCHPTKEIPETNRAVFKSPEEAEKAGFKLAKNCQ
jgi:hypothetical protein